jgi:regulator of sigma D
MVIAIITLLTVLVGILVYLLYINFRKLERTEQYAEAYVKFISALYFRFYETREHMKEVDRRGAFQSDDEVGFVFKELDQSIDDLYEFITKYVNTETEEDKKAED